MKALEHFFVKKKLGRRNFIIFSIILNLAGITTVSYYFFLFQSKYYLTVYLIAGAAGIIIESLGTKLGMWEYYNKEKPPPVSFFGWGSAVTIIMWFINVLKLI